MKKACAFVLLVLTVVFALGAATVINLSFQVTGILAPVNGGTGQDSSAVTGNPTVTAGVWSFPLPGVTPRASTCTSNLDTILAADRTGYVSWSDASACAVTLPQANSTGFGSNFAMIGCDIGAGTATITPTTSTISYSTGSGYTSAASTLALATGQCALIYSNNTNYFAVKFAQSLLGTDTSIVTGTGSFTASNIACGDGNGGITPCTVLPFGIASVFNSGTITVPSGKYVLVGCTSTCSVPVPVPAANYQICVKNDAGITTVITLSALGSSAMYPKADDSGYGTAGTGTMVSTAAAGNKVCLVGRDSTHYELAAVNDSTHWTVN